jgi:hypothetical protein
MAAGYNYALTSSSFLVRYLVHQFSVLDDLCSGRFSFSWVWGLGAGVLGTLGARLFICVLWLCVGDAWSIVTPSWLLLHSAWCLVLGRSVLALDLCVAWCISSLTCVLAYGIPRKEREGIDVVFCWPESYFFCFFFHFSKNLLAWICVSSLSST